MLGVKCFPVMQGLGERKTEHLCTDRATPVGNGWEGTDTGAGMCSWLPCCFCFILFLVRLVQEQAQNEAQLL